MAMSASSSSSTTATGRSISSLSISYSQFLWFLKQNHQNNQINYGFNTKYTSLVINCSSSEMGLPSDSLAFSLNENGTSRGSVKWRAGDREQNIDPKVTMAIAREVADVTRLGIERDFGHPPKGFNQVSARRWPSPVTQSPMGSYINTFSLHYPTRLHTYPKSQQKSSLPLQNSLYFNSILKISPKPTSVFSYLNKPISNYPQITSSPSPHKRIITFVSEKIVILLVGSFIFMGFFNKRPVLAQSTHEIRQSQSTETQNGEFDEEEMMYMKLLENNPKNVESLKSVFHGKMKRGKTKEAIEYVERLIAIEPKEVEWKLLQALCYEMIGEYSKAKSLFKNILKENPLLIRALHGLAMVMHKNLEGPAVFEMLNKVLEIARQKKKVTEERNIRILIAQMHVVKGELDDALKLFKYLIDDNPRDFRPYLCQGIVYSLLDRKEEAEEQFLTYQSLVPDEFPQRGFLEDVVLAAKTEIRQKRKKEFSYKK